MSENWDDDEDEEEFHHFQVKVLMVGDSGVGKTSLLLRYDNDVFNESYVTTIGIDFKTKYLDVGDKRVRLQIWDTAGQERFRTITTSYFRGAQGILLCFEVSDRNSFNSIGSWLEQITSHADQQVCVIICGTKCDSKREVTAEQGQALADKHGYTYIECSAKENHNVVAAFEAIAHEIVEKWKLGEQAAPGAAAEEEKKGLDVARTSNAAPKKKCC
jgi:Ras-related protein Rab-8A